MWLGETKIEPTVKENAKPIQRIPPDNYVCHRCQIKGHYVQNCPGVFDRRGTKFEHRSIRRPIGIPKSKLMEIDEPTEYSYLTNDGRHVVDINLYQALQKSSSNIVIPQRKKLNREIPNTNSSLQSSSTTQPSCFPNVSTFKITDKVTSDSSDKTRKKQSSPLIFDWNNSLEAPLIQKSDAQINKSPVRPQWISSNSTTTWDVISKIASASNQQSVAAMKLPVTNNGLQNSLKWTMSQTQLDDPVQMPQVQPSIAALTDSVGGIVPPVIIDEKLTQDEDLRKFKLQYFRQLERSVQQTSEGASQHHNHTFDSQRNDYDSRRSEYPKKDGISIKYDDAWSLSRRRNGPIERNRSRERRSRNRQRSTSRRRYRERSRSRDRYRTRSRSRDCRSRNRERSMYRRKNRERSISRDRYRTRSKSKGQEESYRERSPRVNTRSYRESSRTRRDVDISRSRRHADRTEYSTLRYNTESRFGRSRSNDRRRRSKSRDNFPKRQNEINRSELNKNAINSKRNPNDGWSNYHDDPEAVRNVQPYSIQLDDMHHLLGFSGNANGRQRCVSDI